MFAELRRTSLQTDAATEGGAIEVISSPCLDLVLASVLLRESPNLLSCR